MANRKRKAEDGQDDAVQLKKPRLGTELSVTLQLQKPRPFTYELKCMGGPSLLPYFQGYLFSASENTLAMAHHWVTSAFASVTTDFLPRVLWNIIGAYYVDDDAIIQGVRSTVLRILVHCSFNNKLTPIAIDATGTSEVCGECECASWSLPCTWVVLNLECK